MGEKERKKETKTEGEDEDYTGSRSLIKSFWRFLTMTGANIHSFIICSVHGKVDAFHRHLSFIEVQKLCRVTE